MLRYYIINYNSILVSVTASNLRVVVVEEEEEEEHVRHVSFPGGENSPSVHGVHEDDPSPAMVPASHMTQGVSPPSP